MILRLDDKRNLVHNTPWDLISTEKLQGKPFSGYIIKAFRVTKGWNVHQLANLLGIKRVSALRRLESKERIGIKRAKELANIFDIADYRIFRSKTDLDKYRPSMKAVEALVQVRQFTGMFIVKTLHSFTATGEEAVKLLVRTKKRKFPETVNEIPLIVEKLTYS